MRKHGTNRPSIAAILAISALLVTGLAGSALAVRGNGNTDGSQSQNGAAAWLVDSGADSICLAESPNTNDNYITDDRPNVWIKSTLAGFDPTTLKWEAYDGKNKLVASNSYLNSYSFQCGTSYLMELGADIYATGSVTVKFFYADGKAFSNDTARFA